MKEWLFFMLLALFGGAVAFLPTSLDFENPELSDIFCPDQMTERGWYLKAITREAIRLEVRNLFNEEPPSGSPGFNVPLDASLSEMFHLYYGQNSSVTRFYRAVNNIAWANAEVDSNEGRKYDTRYHFDGNNLTEGQTLLANRHRSIVSSINYGQAYDIARELIGQSLHAIEDFYSHSNWIELGNMGIIDKLGIPGFHFDNVASPDDQTCLPCSTAEGVCGANVILGGKITSGYYEYNVSEAASFIIPKPDATGKCSFGGKLDTSKSKDPIGGINKASTSPCFSSHNYLHFDAVNLAIQAAQNYLGIVRDAIGNEQFRFLLDLYRGSALCIVIDTTGSMSNEIEAVQEEVQLIVDTTPADLYILVPYNDPDYGPLTSTSDPDEFMVAVNALIAAGGGDAPEKVWHGLQLALTNTPDYSTLYLFTDAGGNDAELMDGDFALAQEKNIVVTVIYSYDSKTSSKLISDDSDYIRLADVTGGQFILIDRFTVDDVVSILGGGIEDSKVTIALRRDVTGDIQFDILVDDTVSSLEITISGEITKAVLTDPSSSVSYDLMDSASLNAASNVNIIAHTLTVKDIQFASPGIGYWNIQISGASTYTVSANGNSILGYMVEFTELDSRPPRPNYHLISGSPIAGLYYYVEIILVGWIESEVVSVSSMDFLDSMGNTLSTVIYNGVVDDEFYVKSNPLPEDNFYVATTGILSTGNAFTRVYETMITPVKVSVDVDLSQSLMAGVPGSTTVNVFDVTNYGIDMTYNYYATDSENFITSFFPLSSRIPANGTDSVTVTFHVPPTEAPWTRSTVVVTASSSSVSFDINSDIAYFIVLPENIDEVPPTCISTDVPSCVGHQSSTTCSSGTWSVSATLHDETGLSAIYSQPSNSETALSVPTFTPGTTDDIDVSLIASCCVTKLSIIGVDQQGNIGTCDYDMGALDGVLAFDAIAEGSTWIQLQWNVTDVRSDLLKYTLNADDMFSFDVRCYDPTCYYNDTGLPPCSLHTYTLTPHFDEFGNGTIVDGAIAITSDSTLDDVPGSPTNLNASPVGPIGTDTFVITWDAPTTHADCVVLYEVCASFIGSTNQTCRMTTMKSYTQPGVELCSDYIISVTSQTSSGLASEAAVITASTGEGAPGEPQNLVAINATQTSVILEWEPPIVNRFCVVSYLVASEETPTSKSLVTPTTSVSTEATIGKLTPCTNYIFLVYAASISNFTGPPAVTHGRTEETDPTTPSTLEVQPQGVSSLYVTWDMGLASCIDHYELCVTDPLTFAENCTDVYGDAFVVTGLRPCTTYNIKVSGVSPGGIKSDSIRGSGSTEDAAPGPVVNLNVTQTTSTSITISFDDPTVNPQCKDWFDTKFIDMIDGGTYRQNNIIQEKAPDNTDTLTGLNPCTGYWIMVRSESSSGLNSDYANATSTTLEALPSPPQYLQVTGVTTDSISLKWFAPMSNPRCAVQYKIIWMDLGTGSGDEDRLDASYDEFEFEYTISSLTPCSIYSIGVSAITPSSNQGFSAPATETTTC